MIERKMFKMGFPLVQCRQNQHTVDCERPLHSVILHLFSSQLFYIVIHIVVVVLFDCR
jgi:hypothetical protein